MTFSVFVNVILAAGALRVNYLVLALSSLLKCFHNWSAWNTKSILFIYATHIPTVEEEEHQDNGDDNDCKKDGKDNSSRVGAIFLLLLHTMVNFNIIILTQTINAAQVSLCNITTFKMSNVPDNALHLLPCQKCIRAILSPEGSEEEKTFPNDPPWAAGLSVNKVKHLKNKSMKTLVACSANGTTLLSWNHWGLQECPQYLTPLCSNQTPRLSLLAVLQPRNKPI